MTVAVVCYLLSTALMAAFGSVYLFRSEFMPYHADAIGTNWESVDRTIQILILALMRVAGGGWLAASLSIAILLRVQLQQGLRWIRWAIPAVGLTVSLPTLYATYYVAYNTPANPPWFAALIGIVLLLVGFTASLLA